MFCYFVHIYKRFFQHYQIKSLPIPIYLKQSFSLKPFVYKDYMRCKISARHFFNATSSL